MSFHINSQYGRIQKGEPLRQDTKSLANYGRIQEAKNWIVLIISNIFKQLYKKNVWFYQWELRTYTAAICNIKKIMILKNSTNLTVSTFSIKLNKGCCELHIAPYNMVWMGTIYP